SICAVSIAHYWRKPACPRSKSIRLVRAQIVRRMSSFHIGAKRKQPVASSVSSAGHPSLPPFFSVSITLISSFFDLQSKITSLDYEPAGKGGGPDMNDDKCTVCEVAET